MVCLFHHKWNCDLNLVSAEGVQERNFDNL